jgi:hypothetical protein
MAGKRERVTSFAGVAMAPNHWPETLEPPSDTGTGEPFIGPWAQESRA